MLDQLIVRATVQLIALAAVTLILELDGGATHTCSVRPAQPGNDKHFWLRLLHLELQTHPPPAAVVAVQLEADSGNVNKIQLGIFSPPVPEAARLDVTLAQLKALLGEENVGSPILEDSHKRESFRMGQFSIPSVPFVPDISDKHRSSARAVRPPETILVKLHDSRPGSFSLRGQRFIVEHAYGPWTSGGAWWNESIWNIQQWDLVAATGNEASLYCSITHDLLRDQWQLTSIYD